MGQSRIATDGLLEETGLSASERLPQAWAATENNLGTALYEQRLRSGGAQATELLAQAVAAHRSALEITTREQLPQDWALTQNNLGLALWQQGLRSEGAKATELLARRWPLTGAPWRFTLASNYRRGGPGPSTTWAMRSCSRPAGPGAPKQPSYWPRQRPLTG